MFPVSNPCPVKKLPIGIQTFSEIVTGNYYYVDKTKILSELTESGKYYFLSRPRRFGKSLFLDTLREAFLGNKEYFQGLYLENNWDWTKKHPVIRIDFGTGQLKNAEELNQRILEILMNNRNLYEVEDSEHKSISGKFEGLIQNLHKKYSQKVVVLVDEYDKPILDNITDKDVAREIRDGLRNLYSVIKGADAYLKFVFITGVSKFSPPYSPVHGGFGGGGLNNLQDITLNENFATVCGYTQSELTNVFQNALTDVNMDTLKLWYNGYNFLGDSVYNPFDILLYLKSKVYKNYWFETGNPSFLIDLIRENNYNSIEIENVEISEESLGAFDVDNIELEALLFQTGYLTIKEKRNILGENIFTLSYPNMEVKKSLTSVILNFLSSSNASQHTKLRFHLYEILKANDLPKLRDVFHSFFASIPQDWYRKNTIAKYEGYYASVFYCCFTALGLDVRAEDVTNYGQVDMTVFFEDRVYVFEFKVIEMTEAGSALQQIKNKRYYEKYLTAPVGTNGESVGTDDKFVGTYGRASLWGNIYLIGVEFSRDSRNITGFEWEKV